MTDTFTIALLIGTLLVLILFIAAIWRKIRNRSGSATMMLGAAHNILNEDQQRAAEVIVLQEAQQKMVEQDTREPGELEQPEE
ncbi:hypothetical protein ACFL3H_03890 [Gemmatimonadota bacterium]